MTFTVYLLLTQLSALCYLHQKLPCDEDSRDGNKLQTPTFHYKFLSFLIDERT